MSYLTDPPDLELGGGVLAWWSHHGTGSDTRAGLLLEHPGSGPTAHDGRCMGGVLFDVPGADGLGGPRWQVESWEPLTISPSVLCGCGWHGWIRDGRWVPA